jgi:hypothetical protein
MVAKDVTGMGKFTGAKFPNAGWHSNWHSAFVTANPNPGWHSTSYLKLGWHSKQ